MSRDDKINKIKSFLKTLLLHLIKQDAEQRTTSSWDVSIENAVSQIRDTNKNQKCLMLSVVFLFQHVQGELPAHPQLKL